MYRGESSVEIDCESDERVGSDLCVYKRTGRRDGDGDWKKSAVKYNRHHERVGRRVE